MTPEISGYRSAGRLVAGVAVLLMIPVVAMQFTSDVNWTVADFVVAGTLLLGTGFVYQWVASRAGNTTYRLAAGLAAGAGLFLIWSNLAVGLIGSEADPANLLYLGVLAVLAVGTALARLRPLGMAWAMFATAAALGLVAVIALAFGLGGRASGPVEIVGVNGFFLVLFAASGALFRGAEAREAARA